MRCPSCGHRGHPVRRIILRLDVLAKDDGSIITSKLASVMKKDIPRLVNEGIDASEPWLSCPSCSEQLFTKEQRAHHRQMGGA